MLRVVLGEADELVLPPLVIDNQEPPAELEASGMQQGEQP